MSNQEMIQTVAGEITKQILRIQGEVIDALFGMTQNKEREEQLKIINELNIKAVMKLKSQLVISKFKTTLIEVLKTKRMFGDISEETLNVFFNTAVQEIEEELGTIGGLIQKEFINALMNDLNKEQIMESLNNQGYGA